MGEQKEQVERIYQRIIFEQCNQDAQFRKFSKVEKEKLKDVLSQKIINQAVFRRSYPQQDYIQPPNTYHPPNIMATLCCFLYPQQNKQSFEVSSALFCKKFFSAFLIWKSDFLNIKDQHAEEDAQTQPDMYGPLWLTITFIIILALSSNLNNYFVDKAAFSFNTDFLIKAAGFELLFMAIQTLLYPAVIGCIDGEISSLQSTNLIGYSLLLYFIPTFLCVIPSQIWHLAMLIVGAVMRFIFLGRNFGSRVDNKHILVYTIILVIQLLHFYLINITFFSLVAGTSVDSGIQKVFHSRVYIN